MSSANTSRDLQGNGLRMSVANDRWDKAREGRDCNGAHSRIAFNSVDVA